MTTLSLSDHHHHHHHHNHPALSQGNERTMRQLTIAAGPTAFASFGQVLAALVKLSFWRANTFLEEGNTEQIEVWRAVSSEYGRCRSASLPRCTTTCCRSHSATRVSASEHGWPRMLACRPSRMITRTFYKRPLCS